MPSNTLHHDKTLAALNTEAKYAKSSRRWARYGRNGEATRTSWARDARKAYNKAHRKSSRLQLNRYNAAAPRIEHRPLFTWPEEHDFSDDLDWTNTADWE